MTYFLVWGRGKQARITRLHCTCLAVLLSSWSGKSTSADGQACRSAMKGGGRGSEGRSQYRECVDRRWILSEHGAVRVRHRRLKCLHCWLFYLRCNPAGGVACQVEHDLEVRSLDTPTKNRPAARDDVGRYTRGNLQAMMLKPVCNSRSCHLHIEHFDKRSQRWDYG